MTAPAAALEQTAALCAAAGMPVIPPELARYADRTPPGPTAAQQIRRNTRLYRQHPRGYWHIKQHHLPAGTLHPDPFLAGKGWIMHETGVWVRRNGAVNGA